MLPLRTLARGGAGLVCFSRGGGPIPRAKTVHLLCKGERKQQERTYIYVWIETYIAVGLGSQDSKQLLRSGPTSRRALPSVIYYLVNA